MSTSVLCGIRPRKFMLRATERYDDRERVLEPLDEVRFVPITRRAGRGRIGKSIAYRVGTYEHVVGVVVDRERNEGTLTRALVRFSGQLRPSARRARIEAARDADERELEAFAYLEGIDALDTGEEAAEA